jgi:RNA polymerase sigma factor (sigma-70 family)
VDTDQTTAAIQKYLTDLGGLGEASPAAPVVRGLLERAVGRLHLLCSTMLHRRYPRLARPPLNLEPDEMLSAVMERLLKAMREVHPQTVRQFFALATQHMRWELNDLARRLDEWRPQELREDGVPAPQTSSSGLTPNARRMLDAIDGLPEDEREAFDLVRIQGLTHTEAAGVVGVATKTIQRRLGRSILLLTERLGDLRPSDIASG